MNGNINSFLIKKLQITKACTKLDINFMVAKWFLIIIIRSAIYSFGSKNTDKGVNLKQLSSNHANMLLHISR